MYIFLDPQILAISLFMNVIISIIKPLFVIKRKVYRVLLINSVLLILSSISGYIFHRTEIVVKNPMFVDICMIAGMSFVLYKIGYGAVADKIKEKL